MQFLNYLKTTYHYNNKSLFISFSEALLWPYRVFAGHQQVTISQDTKCLNTNSQPQAPDADTNQEKFCPKHLIYKAPRSGFAARACALLLFPFSLIFGGIIKASTLISKNVRARVLETKQAITVYKNEISALKAQTLSTFKTRNASKIEFAEYAKNYGEFQANRDRFFEDFNQKESEVANPGQARLSTWKDINFKDRFKKLYTDAVDITSQLLRSMNIELQNNSEKEIDPTDAAKRLVLQDNYGSLGKHNYSHALMHASLVDLYQIYRDQARTQEEAKAFYTLGTDEYKIRVMNNTFVKHAFYTMYGQNNSEKFHAALKRADNRFTQLAAIDSIKTNGYLNGLRA